MDAFMKYISRIHRCSNLWRVEQLKDEELTGIQHIYIFHICKNPGISQEKLTQRISVNKSNVARQLSSLQNNGFIIRKTSEQDKRVYEVYPTDKALRLYPVVVDLMEKWNGLLLNELDETERKLLLQVLPKIAKKAKELSREGGIEE